MLEEVIEDQLPNELSSETGTSSGEAQEPGSAGLLSTELMINKLYFANFSSF